MKSATPPKVYLKDYTPPPYNITDVFLIFELDDTRTRVHSTLRINRTRTAKEPLVLDGEDIDLKNVLLDGIPLDNNQYQTDDKSLTIFDVPESFTLEIENEINPQQNTRLEGLYKSGDLFCTQNEAQGFRRITYYLDRPDVMAKFTTKIIADKIGYPILLSNGNPIDSGEMEDGKHYRTWEDPFPKPCYLYALVAGDLGVVEDSYSTASNRQVQLLIYCDKNNEPFCGHAMSSLKKAMKWDEDTFGLEYDLDIYMIVAVDAFNMGAMENKGLNIFNSSCILADSQTAVDSDFLRIESIVAHEYFHNWTGNRVTCRDWFQLTLKEGLTVFRDQEFSADINSSAIQRIAAVSQLRNYQFPEDDGPTAHPIKPQSYMEINNFYTGTVYLKGAEVIRMLQKLLGHRGFRRGMEKYFELFDGQAVTTEDFLHAMSVANNDYDLSLFKNWYSQAGTPTVSVQYEYQQNSQKLNLTLEQSHPQIATHPLLIPLDLGLIHPDRKDEIASETLILKEQKQTFTFKNMEQPPLVSLNRNFTAPVKIHLPHTFEQLTTLLSCDSDPFNRYDAAQNLGQYCIRQLKEQEQQKFPLSIRPEYIAAWGSVLNNGSIDNHLKAYCLALPSESLLNQEQTPMNFESTHKLRRLLMKTLAQSHRQSLENLYQKLSDVSEPYSPSPTSMGKRSLKNAALGYLASLETSEIAKLCYDQFNAANNMTDSLGPLSLLAEMNSPYGEKALQQFRHKWKDFPLVIQKWLKIQASSHLPDTLERILLLEKDNLYKFKNPNFFRSLVGTFAHNYIHFHNPTGQGYRFVVDRILQMDSINPQLAARTAEAFRDYKKLPSNLQTKMKEQLEYIIDSDPSKNTYEIISKILTA